jgi:L-asparaginase
VTGRPRVALVGLGGTIAITGAGPDGDAVGRSAGDLLATVPGLDVDVEPVELALLPGSALTLDDLLATAAAVRERLEAGASGVVVTQGTDTIEETAYLLDLLHDRPEPVVVTGAMRGPTLAGDDGPANLLAAVRVAASAEARGLGCVVVFADGIHAAARVRKTHASSIATFQSPDGGPLGYVVEGRPWLLHRPVRRVSVAPPPAGVRWPRVDLRVATLGEDAPRFDDGLDGLVVAGFGVGHVPPTWAAVLGDLAGRIPVVLASRTGAGPVLASTYPYAGSEKDLRDRGLVPAGLLHPYKARILLLLALAAGHDRAAVADLFARAGGEG